MAEGAEEVAHRHDAPIFTQRDVQVSDPTLDVTCCTEKPGEPPPTLRICREAVEWAVQRGIGTIWIVAALPHLPRVKRDLRYAIEEAHASIKIKVYVDPNRCKEDWYCPDSTQVRTQSRGEWEKRERIIMLLPMFVYRLVAS